MKAAAEGWKSKKIIQMDQANGKTDGGGGWWEISRKREREQMNGSQSQSFVYYLSTSYYMLNQWNDTFMRTCALHTYRCTDTVYTCICNEGAISLFFQQGLVINYYLTYYNWRLLDFSRNYIYSWNSNVFSKLLQQFGLFTDQYWEEYLKVT